MSVYFTGCPHLGHKAISKYRKWVNSPADNTAQFVDQWKKTIRSKDIVYMLGDVAFNMESLELLKPLHGRKILIKGNHDDYCSSAHQMEVFEEIHGILKYKAMWLTHCPIHPDEMRNRIGNVHAHVHLQSIMKRNWYGKTVLNRKYFNCGVDVLYPQTGSWFASLEQVKEYFNK